MAASWMTMSVLSSIFIYHGFVGLLCWSGPVVGDSLRRTQDSSGPVAEDPLRESEDPSGPACLYFDPPCSPSFTNHSSSSAGQDTDQKPGDSTDEGDKVLTCLFASVPYIGGKWLKEAARKSFSDEALLEASLSFLEGGELVAMFVDLGTTSAASRLLKTINNCFDGHYHNEAPSGSSESRAEHNTDPSNHLFNEVGGETTKPPLGNKQTNSRRFFLRQRRKRTLTDTESLASDSLIGFNLLGLLVVGALITYLVYLLV
ncbi:uncharacterized protein [Cherax quadricarinatus]|uniref:uncharacterized protein n=1 Tax=Cherax quadricarinatus TaxID=27406 RepID=UPI00387E55E2